MLVALLGAVVTVLVLWLLLVGALLVARPRGVDLAEAKRFGPDLVRLVRALAKDPTLPRSVRRRLGFLIVYLALPIDLVPDIIPVLGYADDVIVAAIVLRSVVRVAGVEAVERHWQGSDVGLGVVHALAGR